MIILAATPIGNLGDTSERLREAFESASAVVAEDTRHTGRLLKLLEIKNRPELISMNDHSEKAKSAMLVERAKTEDLLVVSDAGMPTVSDPGFTLVREAIAQGVRVTALPGPSAVPTALALSGLPTDRFVFEGFVPRRHSDRIALAEDLKTQPRTAVMFESPTRTLETLEFFLEMLGPEREGAVCRELTKLHEEVARGTLQELVAWAKSGVRGEVVILIAGSGPVSVSAEQAVSLVLELSASGMRLKDATKTVAAQTGLSARDLYQEVLNIKHTKE